MKVAISITTYNRPKILLDQLKTLHKQLIELEYDAEIFVVNDGSLKSYTKVKEYLESLPYKTRYDRFNFNMGKEKHWQIVNFIFQWYQNRDWDFAIYLQDDLILPEGFIKQCIQDFQLIQHRKKVCLNLVLEESRNFVRCWTPVNPVRHRFDKKEFYRVGWVELHFIANREFFNALNYCVYPIDASRWDTNPHLSSGVGRQISFRLYKKRMGMFQVTKSLAVHGEHKSQMNPNERKVNPLRSV